jgi:hypothetical protein
MCEGLILRILSAALSYKILLVLLLFHLYVSLSTMVF